MRKHAALGTSTEGEMRAHLRWSASKHDECMTSQNAGQAQEKDQADHTQDVIDTATPVNQPSNDQRSGRNEQTLESREQKTGTSRARSFIRELQHALPSLAL